MSEERHMSACFVRVVMNVHGRRLWCVCCTARHGGDGDDDGGGGGGAAGVGADNDDVLNPNCGLQATPRAGPHAGYRGSQVPVSGALDLGGLLARSQAATPGTRTARRASAWRDVPGSAARLADAADARQLPAPTRVSVPCGARNGDGASRSVGGGAGGVRSPAAPALGEPAGHAAIGGNAAALARPDEPKGEPWIGNQVNIINE